MGSMISKPDVDSNCFQSVMVSHWLGSFPDNDRDVLHVDTPLVDREASDLSSTGPLDDWTRRELVAEMDRILGSQFFSKSAKLSRFLRMTVEYLLEGKAEQLKEYTIGTVVYGRNSSYDPAIDSIVRTEARRLRSKLNEFYFRNSISNAVMITFVAGSYVPVIKVHKPPYADHRVSHTASVSLPSTPTGIRVAVAPFRACTEGDAARNTALNLTDELTYRLSQRSEIRVFRSSSDRDSESFSQLSVWRRSGVNAIISGSVRMTENRINMTVQLATMSGMILWAQRFDLSTVRGSMDGFPDEVEAAVVNRLENKSESPSLVD